MKPTEPLSDAYHGRYKENTPTKLAGVFLLQRKGAAAVSYVRIAISEFDKLKKKMDEMKKAPQKVMRSLASDAKKRVPGWVATEVSKVYGIKKTEITGKKVGSVKVTGSDIKDMKFIYAGRMLTPTHFSMAPKVPKEGGSYTLKATIIKGQRSTLGKVKKLTKKQRAALAKNFTRSGTRRSDHSPVMLMRANGGQFLPFQRKSHKRKDIQPIKTVSLPQMVSSERTKGNIQAKINEGLGERLEHHLDRYMPGE